AGSRALGGPGPRPPQGFPRRPRRRLARARHRPPPLPAPAASHSRRCPRAGRARGGGAPRRGPRPLSLRSRPTDHHAGRQRDRRPRPRRRDRLRHDHLVSWAGLCPRLDESAGKRLSPPTPPRNPWLKTTLVQAAWAASRKKDGYLRAQFLRLKSRRGPKKPSSPSPPPCSPPPITCSSTTSTTAIWPPTTSIAVTKPRSPPA